MTPIYDQAWHEVFSCSGILGCCTYFHSRPILLCWVHKILRSKLCRPSYESAFLPPSFEYPFICTAIPWLKKEKKSNKKFPNANIVLFARLFDPFSHSLENNANIYTFSRPYTQVVLRMSYYYPAVKYLIIFHYNLFNVYLISHVTRLVVQLQCSFQSHGTQCAHTTKLRQCCLFIVY